MSSYLRSPSLESIASSALSSSDEEFKLDPMPMQFGSTCTINIIERPTTSERMEHRSLSEGAKLELLQQQDGEMKEANAPSAIESPGYSEHDRFFLPAQNIFFLVSNTIYSVPRAPFEWHSSAFTGKGLSRDDPLILEDINVSHFDKFLSILYPYTYGVCTASTVEEWTAILHLADKWAIQSIRTLAIKQLLPIATDIQKIILGRQYAIDEWLGDAYFAICLREHCLSKEEGKGMDKDDIIEISAIRHQFGLGAQSKVMLPLSIGEVCVRFGLVDFGLPHSATYAAPEGLKVFPLQVWPSLHLWHPRNLRQYILPISVLKLSKLRPTYSMLLHITTLILGFIFIIRGISDFYTEAEM